MIAEKIICKVPNWFEVVGKWAMEEKIIPKQTFIDAINWLIANGIAECKGLDRFLL